MDNDSHFLPVHPDEALERLGTALQRWEIDTSRSRLTFNLPHLIVQQIRGQFNRWGGTLFVYPKQQWLSGVVIWVDLASITTEDSRRDARVVSRDFLDIGRYPTASFKSKSIDTPDGELMIEGLLSLHGITHGVQIQVELGEITTDPDGRSRLTCGARCVVNRQSFGLHWDQDLDVRGVVVGDSVEIRASVEAVYSAPSTP